MQVCSRFRWARCLGSLGLQAAPVHMCMSSHTPAEPDAAEPEPDAAEPDAAVSDVPSTEGLVLALGVAFL